MVLLKKVSRPATARLMSVLVGLRSRVVNRGNCTFRMSSGATFTYGTCGTPVGRQHRHSQPPHRYCTCRRGRLSSEPLACYSVSMEGVIRDDAVLNAETMHDANEGLGEG